MTQLAELGIKIEAGDIKSAIRDLDRLEKEGNRAEKTTGKLSSGFSALGGAIAAVGLGALITSTFRTTIEFEKLKSSLVTVTGSAEEADKAMAMINGIVTDMPFGVQELTQGFIKLKALGLDPSQAAMVSYANTASAMGKDLNQAIEAVADAATGEFERLKEFGIKSKSEGDNVAFTFQGITTTVKKEAASIEGYLRSIGDVQFAGAAERQMQNIGGAVSNLGVAFEQLMVQNDGLPGATAAINEFTTLVSDPAFKESFDSFISGVATLAGWTVKATVGIVDLTKETAEGFAAMVGGSADFNVRLAEMESKAEDLRGKIESLDNWDGTLRKALYGSKEELNAELEDTERRIKGIKEILAEEAATKTPAISATAEPTATGAAPPAFQTIPEDGLSDKEKEALQKRLDSIKEQLATENELALMAYTERLALLDELEANHIGTEDERNELRLEAAVEYEDTITQIKADAAAERARMDAKAAKDKAKSEATLAAIGTEWAEKGGKGALDIVQKYAAKKAQTWVNQAVLSAFADTPGPIWVKAAAATVAGTFAGGLASSLIGGGGGGGGKGGGGGVTSSAGSFRPEDTSQQQSAEEKQTPKKEVTISMPGLDPMSEAAREMARTISQALADMGSDTTIKV
jgi:phage tail tape-measure protein